MASLGESRTQEYPRWRGWIGPVIALAALVAVTLGVFRLIDAIPNKPHPLTSAQMAAAIDAGAAQMCGCMKRGFDSYTCEVASLDTNDVLWGHSREMRAKVTQICDLRSGGR